MEFENFKLDCTQAETGTDELLWTLAYCVCACAGACCRVCQPDRTGWHGMMPGDGLPSQAAFQAECGPVSHLTSALIHILICDVMSSD